MRSRVHLTVTVLVLLAASALANPEAPGQVRLPLTEYQQLLETIQEGRTPQAAPAGYALGQASAAVKVVAQETRASAAVEIALTVDVLEDRWVLVPLLPTGTSLQSVTVAGEPVRLIPSVEGLAWSTQKTGSYQIQLSYLADATRSASGYTLTLPLPAAASTDLALTLPGSGLKVGVIPSAGLQMVTTGPNTRVTATVPTSHGVQVTWQTAETTGHSLSRAAYVARLVGDSLELEGDYDVELFTEEPITLPLLPRTVTLGDVRVDGEPSPILIEGQRFVTRLRGKGKHTVKVSFHVPVNRSGGSPHVDLEVPQIPVSRFQLTLPGKKELSVSPHGNIEVTTEGDSTVATVHVPLTGRVRFDWSEAVPEEIRAETRANASIFHTARAEEGVLYVKATVQYEVRRGETSVIELAVPAAAQVERVFHDQGIVSDWRVLREDGQDGKRIRVFLDRQLQGALVFRVAYDLALARGETPEAVEVPLLNALGAQRQRGMVALLADRELTLEPAEESGLTRVGENQLPAFIRDSLELTVAHTFKYAGDIRPQLRVEPRTPERVQGRFDAETDTLISLGDVALTGAVTVGVNVKSGSLTDLLLELPPGVNLLNLSAPSMRTHDLVPAGDRQHVTVEFTREMTDRFHVELSYEKILTETKPELPVPLLSIPDAEVEQGRLAIEARSAAEVQPATIDGLTGVDVADLPRRLVLRTTNPILLAYKYIRTETPPRLALNVTRHPAIDVQEAAIDRASYSTLFTSDGLLVTTALFTVRNSSKQFLRVWLPEGSEVWAASVDGRPERPAMERSEDGEQPVLIKILNSTEGFPVRLVYATSAPPLGGLGVLDSRLPRPDILVTATRWDLFLPDSRHYGEPSTNLTLVSDGVRVAAGEIEAMAGLDEAAANTPGLLHVEVPASGVHFAAEKIYANQSDRASWFRVSYTSPGGWLLGQLFSLVGVALLWGGTELFARAARPRRRAGAVALSIGGLASLLVCIGVYDISPTLALAVALGLAVIRLLPHLRGLAGTVRQPRSAES